MLTDAVFDCINGPDSSPSLYPFPLSCFLFCVVVVVVSVSWASPLLLDLDLSHMTHFGQQNEVESDSVPAPDSIETQTSEAFVCPMAFLLLSLP